MPALINSVNCVSLTAIEGTDCIGDTYIVINENITKLGKAACTINVNNVSNRSSLGTLTRSLSVYNTAGTYLGYIPIYV